MQFAKAGAESEAKRSFRARLMRIENLNMEFVKPGDIERRSMEIIKSELPEGVLERFPEAMRPVLLRVIHTSADFDYAENLKFSENAAETALEVIKRGATFVTDTNMALSGINKAALAKLGCKAVCYMSDPDTAVMAESRDITRAAASMERAAKLSGNVICAVGNAPTALTKICELYERGEFVPALVIGVPVGFVNVVQSKELLMSKKLPYITAVGRKGGSNIAAAVCNALLYQLTR